MKKGIINIIFLLASTLAIGQNAANDFKQMNQFYLDHQHVSMNIEYRFYKNHTTAEALQVQHAKYKKTGDQFYYKMDDIVTIQNRKHKVVVYNGDKVLMVGQKTAADPAMFTSTVMDSVLKLCSKIKYNQTNTGKKRYTLHYAIGGSFPYSKIIVELTKNNHLSRLAYYYKSPINYTPEDDVEEAPKLEVIYKNTSLEAIPASQYNTASYIKISGDKINPVNQYKNYRLVDLYHQKI